MKLVNKFLIEEQIFHRDLGQVVWYQCSSGKEFDGQHSSINM